MNIAELQKRFVSLDEADRFDYFNEVMAILQKEYDKLEAGSQAAERIEDACCWFEENTFPADGALDSLADMQVTVEGWK